MYIAVDKTVHVGINPPIDTSMKWLELAPKDIILNNIVLPKEAIKIITQPDIAAALADSKVDLYDPAIKFYKITSSDYHIKQYSEESGWGEITALNALRVEDRSLVVIVKDKVSISDNTISFAPELNLQVDNGTLIIS